jgi:hypothetical protein
MDYPSEVTERAATSAAKCDGCDEAYPTRAYAVVLDNPAIHTPLISDYCASCADLARMNWSGTIRSIRALVLALVLAAGACAPTSSADLERAGEDCKMLGNCQTLVWGE